MPNGQPVKMIACTTCQARHYPGEPCPRCFHQAKDRRDIIRAKSAQQSSFKDFSRRDTHGQPVSKDSDA